MPTATIETAVSTMYGRNANETPVIGSLRYDASMLTRADDLATMSVLDENGNPVVLGTLWHDKTAVLVFTRHFG